MKSNQVKHEDVILFDAIVNHCFYNCISDTPRQLGIFVANETSKLSLFDKKIIKAYYTVYVKDFFID